MLCSYFPSGLVHPNARRAFANVAGINHIQSALRSLRVRYRPPVQKKGSRSSWPQLSRNRTRSLSLLWCRPPCVSPRFLSQTLSVHITHTKHAKMPTRWTFQGRHLPNPAPTWDDAMTPEQQTAYLLKRLEDCNVGIALKMVNENTVADRMGA